MTTYAYPTTSTQTDFIPAVKDVPAPTRPTLEDVLQQQRILPAYSLVLGMCEDQLPLILDLTEPSSGSFLIAADSGFSNTSLLHSILTSALMLNTDSEVNTHLISPQADSLTHIHNQPNFKISYQPDRKECEIVLEEMTSLIESRQHHSNPEPIHVLFIDSLDILWGNLSALGKTSLMWIATYGPQHGLYVFSTLESDYFSPKLFQLIDCFPSRILGNIKQKEQGSFLSGFPASSLTELAPETEYLTITGGVSFQIQVLPSEFDR